jgi:signal transduction histidine kinase
VLAHVRADTARTNRLNALALELRNNAPEESAALFWEALRLSQQLAYVAGVAEAQLGLGFYYRHCSEYELASAYSQQARQNFQRVSNRRGQTRSLYNLACIFSEQGRYVESLTANLQGLALAEAEHDQRWLAFLNAQLGITSTCLGEFDQAQRYLTEGLRWARQSGDATTLGHVHRGLGDLYRRQGKWAQAQRHYERDAVIFKRLENEAGSLLADINIGDMQERQGHYAEALALGFRSLARARRLQALGEVPRAQLVLARAYLHAGRADSAVAYGQQSLRAAQHNGAKEHSRDASEILAQASFRLGHFAQAYRYEQLFGSYKDTLNNSDLQRQAAVLAFRAELAKKQAQIGLLTKNGQLIQKQNQKQRVVLIWALLSLGAVGGLSMVLWRNNAQKQQAYALLKRQQDELRAAQNQLVQAEKWAFVGELSAGIAHELQNPLSFMKNFAEVSTAMLDKSYVARPAAELEQEILAGLKQNLLQISQHGQRASSIINDMLEHARTGTGQRIATDLNALAAESLDLAYQGLQATDKTFRATLDRDLDPRLNPVAVVPQDLRRVLLNLCANAMYAVRERQQQAVGLPAAYQPTVAVITRQCPGKVEIRVRDNGVGMSAGVQAKIFQPFFTTKPVGEGTGLGLSLSHDIVVAGHGGTLTVESREEHGTEFRITLPQ